AAAAKPKRLHRLLDSLCFPPAVEEAMIDALCEAGEKLESAHRSARAQESTSPAANLVPRIGLVAFNAVGEVRHLVGAIVERKGSCVILDLKVGDVRGRMFEAHGAVERQIA